MIIIPEGEGRTGWASKRLWRIRGLEKRVCGPLCRRCADHGTAIAVGDAIQRSSLQTQQQQHRRARVMTIPPHWLDDVVDQALHAGCQEPGKLAAAIGKHDCFVAAVKAGLAEFERGRGLSQAQAVRQAIIDAIESHPPESSSTAHN